MWQSIDMGDECNQKMRSITINKPLVVTKGSSTGTVHKIYIGNHTLITQSGTTYTPSYLLRDHLGSLVAVADKNGVVQEKLSYDAWGKC